MVLLTCEERPLMNEWMFIRTSLHEANVTFIFKSKKYIYTKQIYIKAIMTLTVINILFTAYPEVLRCFVTITAIVAGITSTPLH